MTDPIDELRHLLPPPVTPVGVPTRTWKDIEADRGLRLPADYESFVETYGIGTINRFLYVLIPDNPWQGLNLVAGGNQRLRALRTLRDVARMSMPYPIFPEPGGVLPCAINDYGDVLYWRTISDNPDEWPMVINDVGPYWDEVDCGLVGLLVGLLQREILPDRWPDDFRNNKGTFVPGQDPYTPNA